jgi:predicted PurR-regulated permease PerM
METMPGQVRSRLQAVMAVVLLIAFLKWSVVATMPVGFALFLIALTWPLQRRLERRLPRKVSFLAAVLVLLLVVGLFVGALWWSGRMVAERSSQYAERVEAVYGQIRAWARSHGFDIGAAGLQGAADLARTAVLSLGSAVSLILLILALAILGLNEVKDFRQKAWEAFPEERRTLIESTEEIVEKYQGYLWSCTIAAILQGLSYWLFALAMGLDFAFVWGVMAFLLNYIPTIGSAVAVVPPSLAVFLGMALLQILFGNYLDPIISGRFVKLSPVMVLISIVFWGWVWGIPGALLGVPITLGIVIATDHFPNTRWVAKMLSEARRSAE